MTASPQSPQQSPRQGRMLSTGTKLLLFVGLPVLALALLVGGLSVLVPVLRATPVALVESAEAGSSVLVLFSSSSLDFRPLTCFHARP